MSRIKKVWLKAEYWATKESVEVAQAAFSECNAIGIEIDDGIRPEGVKLYPDDQVLITAYFEHQEESLIQETLARFIKECGLMLSPLRFSLLEEDDWQGNFVRSCTTFVVEPNIFIVPSFEIDQFKENQRDELFIEMDPENAFGTGQHQTTKLCLKNIQQFLMAQDVSVRQDFDCLDVGTGSGILAILMKKLGVNSVLATETDEDALLTAQKNAKKNGVLIQNLVVTEDHIYDPARYDLVVANILAPVLIAMAKNLCDTIKPTGYIILSGILLDQADNVIRSYEEGGARFFKKDTMDDWCALMFKKCP